MSKQNNANHVGNNEPSVPFTVEHMMLLLKKEGKEWSTFDFDGWLPAHME